MQCSVSLCISHFVLHEQKQLLYFLIIFYLVCCRADPPWPAAVISHLVSQHYSNTGTFERCSCLLSLTAKLDRQNLHHFSHASRGCKSKRQPRHCSVAFSCWAMYFSLVEIFLIPFIKSETDVWRIILLKAFHFVSYLISKYNIESKSCALLQ